MNEIFWSNKPAAEFMWFCHEKAGKRANFEKRGFILTVVL
jgi:hypothetical protein